MFVADDHPVFCEAVGRGVEMHLGYAIAGCAMDGSEALDAIRALVPTVAVLDEHLRSLSGIEILRAIREDRPAVRVLMLTGDDSKSLIYEVMELGAAGYLHKSATLIEICDAIRGVAEGDTVVGPSAHKSVVDELRARTAPRRSRLTTRELEVLKLLVEGLSAPRIAERLGIGAATVRTHIRHVFWKLGVKDRAAAAAEAVRRGLVR